MKSWPQNIRCRCGDHKITTRSVIAPVATLLQHCLAPFVAGTLCKMLHGKPVLFVTHVEKLKTHALPLLLVDIRTTLRCQPTHTGHQQQKQWHHQYTPSWRGSSTGLGKWFTGQFYYRAYQPIRLILCSAREWQSITFLVAYKLPIKWRRRFSGT